MSTRRRKCSTILSIGLCTLALSACKPNYDTDDPDYGYFANLFKAAQTKEQVADMSRLNGGDWKTACIFGGYENPVDDMEKLGATIAEADRERMKEARDTGFRVSVVEEFEMMIAYIDQANKAHFIHFEDGIGAQGQYYNFCVTRPETKITLFGP